MVVRGRFRHRCLTARERRAGIAVHGEDQEADVVQQPRQERLIDLGLGQLLGNREVAGHRRDAQAVIGPACQGSTRPEQLRIG